MSNDLKQTVLHAKHVEAGGKMVPFAGWSMPVQYSSVKLECQAVREKSGVFDVSHMGEFFVKGPQAVDFVDYILTNDFKSAAVGKAVYSPLCRENGTIIDDLIAYKLGESEVLICVNAANIEKDWNWIDSQKSSFECELTNHSDEYSLFAVQGPQALSALTQLGFQLSDFEYYSANRVETPKYQAICARTGYTGEDGFEIFIPNEQAVQLWDEILATGVVPCGLAARDVLRLEVCFPLYGNELNDEVTPLDAGLKWTVKFSKNKFIGKESLESYEQKFKLIKASLDKGIPREGYNVVGESGTVWGKVTSGGQSVALGKGIALISLKKETPKEEPLFIEIRGKQYPAIKTTKPFVTGGHK